MSSAFIFNTPNRSVTGASVSGLFCASPEKTVQCGYLQLESS
jgi:hypothetical protein